MAVENYQGHCQGDKLCHDYKGLNRVDGIDSVSHVSIRIAYLGAGANADHFPRYVLNRV